MKRSLFAALVAGAFLALSAVQVSAQDDADQYKDLKPAKYVFLFIGDGMSLPQRMMAEEFNRKLTGKGLTINAMPQQSFTRSSSANSFITDSAASGTAIACGEKTNNQRLGVAPDGKRKLESVAEVAKKNGRSVGILTSITINHATPGAFYAHNESRENYYDIGMDLVNSGFDYFGGGGLQNNRGGDADLYKIAESKGYTVAYKDEVPKVDLKKADKLFVRGHNGALPDAIDRPDGEWTLADYTQQCIDFLMLKDKPFFVMVEGGNIDHHGHGNDAAANIRETIDFDKAVTVAINFAKDHPDDTLVVVTGDHETGGMTLGFANTEYSSYIELLKNQKCSGDKFKNTYFKEFVDGILGPAQPAFPFGGRNQNQESQAQEPKEEKTIKFDDVKPIVNKYFGLVFDQYNKTPGPNYGKSPAGTLILNKGEQDRIEEAFNREFPDGKRGRPNFVDRNNTEFQEKKPDFRTTILAVMDNRASVGWTSGAHTALPVDTSAYGVDSNIFSGMYENSDIAKKLKAIVSVPVK